MTASGAPPLDRTRARAPIDGGSPPSATKSKGPVAYICHYFPALTQTFVYREVLALEARGWEVRPISIRRPARAAPAAAAVLAQRTTFILPARWGRSLGRQLGLCLRHPRRYLGTLLELALAPGKGWRARLHGLQGFVGAMEVVPELERAGVRHLHAHFGTSPATVAMAAARFLGLPFSLTLHARDLFVAGPLLEAKLAKAEFVVTISRFNSDHLKGLAGAEAWAKKLHVVHCGIDEAHLEQGEGPRPFDPAGARKPLIVSVGRLVPKKGHGCLLAAARLLKDRRQPFELWIVGDGPLREELERRWVELDLRSEVTLAGALPEERVHALLKKAQAFALASLVAADGDQDGIPVALMEAMALGLPCVSTRVSGIPELIEDDREGLLVPPNEPAALAAALERLLGDPAAGARLGQAGRDKVARSFTLKAGVEKLERLFSATIQSRA